jgi:uncharacterized protein (DUF1501 family)
MAKKLTRRQFLKYGAITAGAATAAPWMKLVPGTNVAWAAGPADAIVVFVQLYGGNDGINMVYPLSGAQRGVYESVRPTLALPDTNGGLAPWISEGFNVSTPLSIGANANGSTYALHPAMKALHDIHTAGPSRLAVVPGVHYPYPDHSHFRSEQIYYSLDPLGSGGLGWFGKYLNYAGFGPTQVPGVNMGESLNPTFTPTNTSVFAFRRLNDLEFPASGESTLKQAKFRDLYDLSDDANVSLYPELVKIGQTGKATIDTMQSYYKQGSGFANAGKVEALMLDGDGDYSRRNDLVYSSPLNAGDNPLLPDSPLSRDMRHVAAIIRSNVGARFFHVATGGYDSHSAQENGFYHSYLLNDVSECVAALYNELNQAVSLPGGYSGYLTGNLANKVVIVTFSEFGRTIRQNAAAAGTAGTDHAACSPQLVVGGSVIGGQHAPYPRLDEPPPDVEDDLNMSVDMRDLFGTILSRWLNVPGAALGPGPGKILEATTVPDDDGNDYTVFTPLGFLAP